MKLAIVINHSPADTTAHMLYICRLAEGLALAAPQNEIHLIFPRPAFDPKKLGISQPPNLHLHPLMAVRKLKKKLGLTLNFIFYHRALAFLKKLQPDVIFSASFIKLWTFLRKHQEKFPNTKFVYEVHDLVDFKPGRSSKEFNFEMDALEGLNLILTTTNALYRRLAHYGLLADILPLACAYNPDDFSPPAPRTPGEPYRFGYIGSTYAGQGVDWLAKNWDPAWGELHVVGGNLSGPGIFSYGRFTLEKIKKEILPCLDALVIPAEAVGRMPYVAFTKSYDYLAFKRPIITSDLPSITEVLRPDQEALVFKASDIKSFAEVLTRLQKNPVLAETLIKKSAARAKEFNWPLRCRKFWELINKA